MTFLRDKQISTWRGIFDGTYDHVGDANSTHHIGQCYWGYCLDKGYMGELNLFAEEEARD